MTSSPGPAARKETAQTSADNAVNSFVMLNR
jgi:hypothetical protein